jgi:hypothetical protein
VGSGQFFLCEPDKLGKSPCSVGVDIASITPRGINVLIQGQAVFSKFGIDQVVGKFVVALEADGPPGR